MFYTLFINRPLNASKKRWSNFDFGKKNPIYFNVFNIGKHFVKVKICPYIYTFLNRIQDNFYFNINWIKLVLNFVTTL